MPGQDPGPLLDPPESTRESLDSLEARFRRAYGRDMTPEERKYFGLADTLMPFDPNGKAADLATAHPSEPANAEPKAGEQLEEEPPDSKRVA